MFEQYSKYTFLFIVVQVVYVLFLNYFDHMLIFLHDFCLEGIEIVLFCLLEYDLLPTLYSSSQMSRNWHISLWIVSIIELYKRFFIAIFSIILSYGLDLASKLIQCINIAYVWMFYTSSSQISWINNVNV